MIKRRFRQPAFTLAELLIALAILGVIATFTIPKILDSGSSSKHNSIAKEGAAIISEAFQLYKMNNTVSASMTVGELTPYINFVKRDTINTIDDHNTNGSINCSLGGNCYLLHNGSILYYATTLTFADTSSTSAVWFLIDPDGQYGGSTTGPSKSTFFWLYTNGRIVTRGTLLPNTYSNTAPYSASPAQDPEYFSWSN